VRHLEAHYREEIVFEDMAKEIGISYSYMRKIVCELTGKSLIDYLNLLRIEKAKQLLVGTPLTMTQIASEVGYSNVQSFNRFFRKFEGMPPSSYKAAKGRIS
jgi:YesN/AraC family two-component response regulator